jgi:hypothetical protein
MGSVREALDTIMKDAVEDWSWVGWAFGAVNQARGVSPGELDPPDYLLATLEVLLDLGLITVGEWDGVSDQYVAWRQPTKQSLTDIRALLAPLDHKPNRGDVADIVSTDMGSEAYCRRLPVLDHAAGLIQERWAQLDQGSLADTRVSRCRVCRGRLLEAG